jgi:hypothetical protein
MTQRSLVSDATERSGTPGELPPPDVVSFIRFCHRRRGATWPELYDEMCAVAARREYKGWDRAELAARGLTFSLFEMPRLAGWTRTVLAGADGRRSDTDGRRGATTPRLDARAAIA